jgi:hypothetical protein
VGSAAGPDKTHFGLSGGGKEERVAGANSPPVGTDGPHGELQAHRLSETVSPRRDRNPESPEGERTITMLKQTVFLAAVAGLAVVALAVPAANAESLPVDNPGFEDPVLTDGDWSWSMDDQGWGYFGNDGYQGSWNVTTADFPGEAPEGENVGWAEGEGYHGGFAQVLTDPDAVLKAGMIYTLIVEVGNGLTSDPFGGYQVQLLAGGTPHTPGDGTDYTGAVTGGTLLAEDDNLLTIPDGTFETSTVTYTYDPAHSGLLGEPLQIRLLAYAASDEVHFDDVRLDAIPEPATLSMLALGGLALLRRRRK